MNLLLRLLGILLVFMCMHSAWGDDVTFSSYKECIDEPVFHGRVCTVQANRTADVGVLLIHGLGGSTDDWKKTIPALAENFHVVAFDLPGFGKSDKGSQSYSPTRYARLVQYLADHYLQNKPYHVVGHSMGGAIALRYAAQHPLRMQRLVLIDPAGILHPQVITKFQAGSMAVRSSGVYQTRGLIERLSGKLLEQAERLPVSAIDIANSALGRDIVLRGGPEKIAALELAGENFSSAISTVTAPTLLLWGEYDLVAPLRTGKVLAARMKRARLEIIAYSAHEPMLEQPQQVNFLLKNHLLATEQGLADSYIQAPPSARFTSERIGSCSGRSDKIFEGDYRSIELNNCSNIIIRKARVGQLKVLNSNLSMIDSDILGEDVGLTAENSDITITNSEISGAIAISALNSRLDLAGANLKATKAVARGVNSKFVFSVSRAQSPHISGYLHTYKNMMNEEF